MIKTVAEAMSHSPVVAKPEMPLEEAIRILADRHISGLPVVDEQGKLLGVISETDLMWRETGVTSPAYIMLLDSVIYLENPAKYNQELHKVLGQNVGEVMTKNPLTASADMPLPDAARLMHDKKVHRLPVIDDQHQVVGILTRGDIIRAMANS